MRRVDGVFNTDIYEKSFRQLYVTGTGSANVPVVINTTDTTHGLGNSFKSYLTTDPPALIGGISMEAWTEAGFIEVQVKGYNTALPVDEDTVAGDILVGSASAHAQLIDYTNSAVSDPESYTHVAVALTDDSAVTNVATGILLDPLGLAQKP